MTPRFLNELSTQKVSQEEVDSESLVHGRHEGWRNSTDFSANAPDGQRADLLGLGFRILMQTRFLRRKKDLKRVDLLNIRRYGYHRHDPPPKRCS